ncbi:MAG TPA: alkaline phosphatase family protein [Stellaceae bacterium]|nr:alkaline phosphatase family protein [Stellaceae bacterium]
MRTRWTPRLRHAATANLLAALGACAGNAPPPWPSPLPVYDHIVIVIEENKDFEQILGGGSAAPYLASLAADGAILTRMFAEEHNSEGNYFWLFSGSDQGVRFEDAVPAGPILASSLGEQLIAKGLSFKGYAEDLPAIGDKSATAPPHYARKHVPWISFAKIPDGSTVATSSNLRFADFPADYAALPTVAIVVPDLVHDMHDGAPAGSIPAGDAWLRQHLDGYYRWALSHNSLLIVTFDENDDVSGYEGLTDPATIPDPRYPPADPDSQCRHDLQNRIITLFAGAHVRPGRYAEGNGVTHVNILRTIEAMYGLPKSGAQQANAARAGIADDAIISDVFAPVRP